MSKPKLTATSPCTAVTFEARFVASADVIERLLIEAAEKTVPGYKAVRVEFKVEGNQFDENGGALESATVMLENIPVKINP